MRFGLDANGRGDEGRQALGARRYPRPARGSPRSKRPPPFSTRKSRPCLRVCGRRALAVRSSRPPPCRGPAVPDSSDLGSSRSCRSGPVLPLLSGPRSCRSPALLTGPRSRHKDARRRHSRKRRVRIGRLGTGLRLISGLGGAHPLDGGSEAIHAAAGEILFLFDLFGFGLARRR